MAAWTAERIQTMRVHPNTTYSLGRPRYRLATFLLAAAFWLAACANGGATANLDAAPKRALIDFPSGIGRGYPTAQLIADKERGTALQVGASAPDFALVLEDGSHLRLSDIQGRPVIINFWATWCGPCRIEMPELMRAASKDADLVLLAVNVQESRETVAPFAEEFEMDTLVIMDADGVLKTRYGVRGLPTTVFVNRAGEIGFIHAGILTPATLEEQLAALR